MRQMLVSFTATLIIIFSGACQNEVASPKMFDFKNYEIEQQVRCFCISPPAWRFYKLTIENDKILKGVALEDGHILSSQYFGFFKTIPQLLEFVESINPDSVTVFNIEYDGEIGFPSSIYVDYSQRIADEEIGYETRNFKALP